MGAARASSHDLSTCRGESAWGATEGGLGQVARGLRECGGSAGPHHSSVAAPCNTGTQRYAQHTCGAGVRDLVLPDDEAVVRQLSAQRDVVLCTAQHSAARAVW